MSQDQHSELGHVVSNGVRLATDTLIIPGASQILDGKIGSGLARAVVGIAARTVLGPIGWLVVGLDSYSKTTSGKGLIARMSSGQAAQAAPAQAAPAQAAPAQAAPAQAAAPAAAKAP
jgi:hypothetical protein